MHNYNLYENGRMQKSSVLVPMGNFTGTTERGECTTVKMEVGMMVEGAKASYQMIRQQGISQKNGNTGKSKGRRRLQEAILQRT